jgi:hypothetical protein
MRGYSPTAFKSQAPSSPLIDFLLQQLFTSDSTLGITCILNLFHAILYSLAHQNGRKEPTCPVGGRTYVRYSSKIKLADDLDISRTAVAGNPHRLCACQTGTGDSISTTLTRRAVCGAGGRFVMSVPPSSSFLCLPLISLGGHLWTESEGAPHEGYYVSLYPTNILYQ